jgi:hypothetical protein
LRPTDELQGHMLELQTSAGSIRILPAWFNDPQGVQLVMDLAAQPENNKKVKTEPCLLREASCAVGNYFGSPIALIAERSAEMRSKLNRLGVWPTCLTVLHMHSSSRFTSLQACRFYRAEAPPGPNDGGGPPYGLLQGAFVGVCQLMHVWGSALIPATKLLNEFWAFFAPQASRWPCALC